MKKDVIKYSNLIDHIVNQLNETTGEEYDFRRVRISSCDVYVFNDGSFSEQPSVNYFCVIAKKDTPKKLLIDAVDLCFRYQRILSELNGTDSETERKKAEIKKLFDSSVTEIVGNFVYCYSVYYNGDGYYYDGYPRPPYIELDSANNYFKYINQELLDETIESIISSQKNSLRRRLTKKYY